MSSVTLTVSAHVQPYCKVALPANAAMLQHFKAEQQTLHSYVSQQIDATSSSPGSDTATRSEMVLF